MSQENVELVREIIAAVPDWNEVSALLHRDARFDQTRIPDGGVYEGREACGRFFERWFGTWDEIRMTPERFIEDGDRVLALMTIEGRGKGSGVPVVIRSADLFTIRDGKIVSLVGYPDRAEALADMGLPEQGGSPRLPGQAAADDSRIDRRDAGPVDEVR
jgi:ketosteroid isomerase-like protein